MITLGVRVIPIVVFGKMPCLLLYRLDGSVRFVLFSQNRWNQPGAIAPSTLLDRDET
jgi:hypothetical protein